MYNTLYLSRRVNKRFLYRDVSAPGRAQPGGTRGAALGLRLSAAGFSLLFFRFLFFSLNDISTYFFSLTSESPAALRVRRRAPNGVGSAERPRGEGDTGRRWGMSVAFLPLRLALPVRVRAEPEPGGAAQNAEPRGRDGKRRAKGSARRGRGDKTDAEETSARRRAPRNAALAARLRLHLAPPRLRDGSAGGGPRAAGELRAVRGAGAAVAVCSVLRFSCQRRLKAALLSAVRAARGRTLTCARLFPNEIGSELSALSAVPPHTAARGSPGARGRAVGAEPRSVRGSAAGSTGRTGSAPPWDGFGKGAVRARGFPEGLAKQRPPARPSGRSTVRRGMGPGEFVSHPLFVWGRRRELLRDAAPFRKSAPVFRASAGNAGGDGRSALLSLWVAAAIPASPSLPWQCCPTVRAAPCGRAVLWHSRAVQDSSDAPRGHPLFPRSAALGSARAQRALWVRWRR